MSGNLRDFSSNISAALSLTSAVINSDTDSTAIDLLDHRTGGFLFVIANSADTLSASNYIELALEDSPDNSTWTACVDADVKNTVTATSGITGTVALINDPAEDTLVVWGEYTGTKRYVRASIDFNGTHTTGTSCAVIGLRTRPHELPA